MTVIYAIFVAGTNWVYVGATRTLKRRWDQHRNHLRAGTHPNPVLQELAREHGPGVFGVRQLEVCEDERAVVQECWWMNACAKRYDVANLRPPTRANAIGFKHSVETRKAMAAQRLGKKGRELSSVESRRINALRGPASQKQREQCRALGQASAKAVRNKTTGEIYASTKAAAAACARSDRSIGDACRGRLATVAGCVWEYVKH